MKSSSFLMAKILIADDQSFLPELIALNLNKGLEESQKHIVEGAVSTDEALDKLRSTVFDLAVVDLDFGERRRGTDVIREADKPQMPFIIHTADPNFRPKDHDVLLAPNVKVVIGKPDLNPVITEIRSIIAANMKFE